jgi:GTPase
MGGRELDLASILAGADEPLPEGHRSGLVAIVGRPNVGKSTLLNRMVGEKVAIVTQVPGTTRNAIRGVVTRPDAQLVFLDTPGLAKPKTLLTRRLNELVRDTWSGVDLICFLVDVAGGIGKGDRFLAAELAGIDTPIVAVANKMDQLGDRAQLLPRLQTLTTLLGDTDGGARGFDDIVPVSAATGENVERLLDVLVSHLREGPRIFRSGEVSDQPEVQLAAEIVREKLIGSMKQELPHSIAVTVDEITPSEDREDLLEVHAVIHVERDSQKGIVIGKGGANLKAAATAAREELEVLLGAKVYLTTHVKVAKEWQGDPKQLGRLGY